MTNTVHSSTFTQIAKITHSSKYAYKVSDSIEISDWINLTITKILVREVNSATLVAYTTIEYILELNQLKKDYGYLND